MGQPVLLIIDMLNDFFKEGPLAEQRATLVGAINELVSAFRSSESRSPWKPRAHLAGSQRGHPVIWVRQEFAPDLSDAFLMLRDRGTPVTVAGTAGCQILPELARQPHDPVIVKKRYSAFFGTELDALLASVMPEPLVVAGVNTHACVRTTVIDAYQRDIRVAIAVDCVSSYDCEHHLVTLRYLEGRVARLMTNTELCATLSRSGQNFVPMACRVGCGACCTAPSISSPIPGMSQGKPAGVRCIQLTPDNRCMLFGRPERPAVCVRLRPSEEMCGRDAGEAYQHLLALELATLPAVFP